MNRVTEEDTKSTKDPYSRWDSNLRFSRLCYEMLQHLLKIKCDSIHYFLHLLTVVKSEASFFEAILYIMTVFLTDGI